MKDEPLDVLSEAEGIIGDGGTSNLGHVGSPLLLLLQTVSSKAIGVQYPWHLQYHPSQITRMDPDILDEVGGIKKKHA